MSLEHRQKRKGASGRLPLLLRVPEAAEELAISERQIYQLVHLGLLDVAKIQKSTRITSESVIRLARLRGRLAAVPGLKQYRQEVENQTEEQLKV